MASGQSLSGVVIRTDSRASSSRESSRNIETTSLVVSLPAENLAPVEQALADSNSYSEFVHTDSDKYPPTIQVPIGSVDGMVGRSTKVYATDETASIEGLNHSFVEMEEPPAPNDIGMSNLAPKQDDKTAQEDALNTTLHQVIVYGPLISSDYANALYLVDLCLGAHRTILRCGIILLLVNNFICFQDNIGRAIAVWLCCSY